MAKTSNLLDKGLVLLILFVFIGTVLVGAPIATYLVALLFHAPVWALWTLTGLAFIFTTVPTLFYTSIVVTKNKLEGKTGRHLFDTK